ncbi:helix-turn-helix transcriptional regulator [Terribacillus sp. 179-K 1B1 HS]|uniref:helix-turn-helix domain-containing protein n=1 Tax=Terribacillus sp. 179-K 1B1 HS TaxID=3142388 RepID=UPI0039A0B73A
MNIIYDYTPLLNILYERGMTKSDLGEAANVGSNEIAKIAKKEPLKLANIAAICAYLDVPIENVVQIRYK